MNSARNDDDLRRLFAAQRAADAESAPSFDNLAGKEHRAVPLRGRSWLRARYIAAAALCLVLLGYALYFSRQSGGVDIAASSISISEWRSPTARLASFRLSNRDHFARPAVPDLSMAKMSGLSVWRSPSDPCLKTPVKPRRPHMGVSTKETWNAG